MKRRKWDSQTKARIVLEGFIPKIHKKQEIVTGLVTIIL